VARLAPPYAPRRPTETVLYGVVRESLDTFVAHARETYERPLPRYVENELRAYPRPTRRFRAWARRIDAFAVSPSVS
jgi:hypothetical protein